MTLFHSYKTYKKKPQEILEIFLQPGEFYWGDAETRIRTILGSCVAVTIWHPRKRVGGMCHIMLPSRVQKQKIVPSAWEYSGRYADEALALMMQELSRFKIQSADCQVKVFGGSNMFSHLRLKNSHQIGDRNLEAVLQLLSGYGFTVHANHYGGNEARYVVFDVWSGDVWMRSGN